MPHLESVMNPSKRFTFALIACAACCAAGSAYAISEGRPRAQIILVVDGEIVDLNRISLPPDTPIIERRSEDEKAAEEAPKNTGDGNEEVQGRIETHPAIEATSADPAFLLPDHRNVISLRFSPDGMTLVTVSWAKAPDHDGTRFVIRTWDVAEKKLAREVELEWDQSWNPHANSMMLSPDRTKVISSLGGQIGIFDAATGKLVKRLEPPPELRPDALLSSLTCTPDLSLIACGRSLKYDSGIFRDAHAIVWEPMSGRVVATVTLKHANHVQSVALSADGKRLAAVGMGTAVEIWDVGQAKLLLSFQNANPGRKHPDPDVKGIGTDLVSSVGFSIDGKLLAVSDMLGVKLLDAASGEVVRRIDAPYRYHSGSPAFVFSPDGQLFALLGTRMTDRVVPIWSTKTGRLVMALATEANGAAFSYDGKWFAVGLSDPEQAVAAWRVESQ